MLLKRKLGKCLGSLLMLCLASCSLVMLPFCHVNKSRQGHRPPQPNHQILGKKHLLLKASNPDVGNIKRWKNWNFKPMKYEVSLSIFQYNISRSRCLKGGSRRKVYTLVSWVFKPHWLLQVTLAYFLVFSYISYRWSHWINDRWHCRDAGLCSRVLEQDKLSCLTNGKESNNLQN